ncbi:T9SS type A sorting domain-containing protein [bacterium]|nr:T9SS type A sorting domain-containing protein [bacterium]RQV97198.1 MAG: T9SS C-terminal target domain-containing protein [bacterium]
MRLQKFLICILITITIRQLSAHHCPLEIGTNLAGPSDWGAEWPFVNIMKYSRQWMTFNLAWVDGGENPWDTRLLDQIPMDENGYPLELPIAVAGAETTQVIRTVWANTATLKEGNYMVLYDGEGIIDIDFDGKMISQSPGRIEFDMKYKDNILGLSIMESRAGNPVRNIRVLLPGTELTYRENPWTEEWLEKLGPFQVLRFMDWGITNDSRLQVWNDRPNVEDYTYTTRGVPYECMINICNLKQADAWVCVPHLADEEYIRKMACLFRDSLNPSLTIYVEYSNEIWNWMFNQTHYCYENGNPDTDWPERIVPFIQNTMDIWTDVFSGQTDRILRVVGVQASWQDVSNRIVFNMRPGSFDAFSPAAYFGFSEAGYDALEQLGSTATAEDVLFWAREAMLTQSCVWIKSQYTSIARKLNIPLVYYEGGQHLTPDPFGSDQPYNQALMDAQTHPDMYHLYQEWLDSLGTFVPEGQTSLFMNFSFISNKSGKYGSWGVLESQFFQHPPYHESAPKYQVLLDNHCEMESGIPPNSTVPSLFRLESVSPNPFNQCIVIQYRLMKKCIIRIQLVDITGRSIATLINTDQPPGKHRVIWNGCGNRQIPLPSGVYICRITAGAFHQNVRVVLLK